MAKRLPVPLDDEQAAWVEQMAARTDLSQARVVSQCVDAVRGEPAPLLADHADGLPDALADLQERVADLEAAVEQATASPHGREPADMGSTTPTRTDVHTPAIADDERLQEDVDDEHPEQRDENLREQLLASGALPTGGKRDGEIEAMVDAVLEAYEHIREYGTAGASDLQRALFPEYAGPYGGETSWYKNCIRPGLQALADVDEDLHPPAGAGGKWQYGAV